MHFRRPPASVSVLASPAGRSEPSSAISTLSDRATQGQSSAAPGMWSLFCNRGNLAQQRSLAPGDPVIVEAGEQR